MLLLGVTLLWLLKTIIPAPLKIGKGISFFTISSWEAPTSPYLPTPPIPTHCRLLSQASYLHAYFYCFNMFRIVLTFVFMYKYTLSKALSSTYGSMDLNTWAISSIWKKLQNASWKQVHPWNTFLKTSCLEVCSVNHFFFFLFLFSFGECKCMCKLSFI